MIAWKIEQFKEGFFDRAKVQRSMAAADFRMRSRFGGRVRLRARHSIRKRKKASEAGKPPSSHTGLLRENILYALEGRNVVIGPTVLNQVAFNGSGQPVRGYVPRVLEHGGETTIYEEFVNGRWRRIDMRFKGNKANVLTLMEAPAEDMLQANARRERPTRKRRVMIAARPFMRPAFDVEIQRAPQLLAERLRAA